MSFERSLILVVEDDPPVRLLVEACLQQSGYPVLLAADGEEALRLFQQQPDRIRLVITDVVMPGMTGLELADRILEQRPEASVLFMSGNHPDADRGFGCLAKPFTFSELRRRVQAALGNCAGASE